MPTYDYQCRNCEMRFEVHHPMDAALPRCPACAGEAERIVMSAPVVQGLMARGRERAVSALPECGKGCRCCP